MKRQKEVCEKFGVGTLRQNPANDNVIDSNDKYDEIRMCVLMKQVLRLGQGSGNSRLIRKLCQPTDQSPSADKPTD